MSKPRKKPHLHPQEEQMVSFDHLHAKPKPVNNLAVVSTFREAVSLKQNVGGGIPSLSREEKWRYSRSSNSPRRSRFRKSFLLDWPSTLGMSQQILSQKLHLRRRQNATQSLPENEVTFPLQTFPLYICSPYLGFIFVWLARSRDENFWLGPNVLVPPCSSPPLAGAHVGRAAVVIPSHRYGKLLRSQRLTSSWEKSRTEHAGRPAVPAARSTQHANTISAGRRLN